MFDLGSWAAAQWILAGWLLADVSVFPAIGVAIKRPERKTRWLGWYLSRVISAAALATVLGFGGFWT